MAETTMQDRRPAAVHSLNHFSLAVPDLAAAETFYRTAGLSTAAEGDALALGTANGLTAGHLYEGPRKALHHLSFGIFPEDLDGFAARLRDLGVAMERPMMPASRDGLWFRDPDGNLIEAAVAPRTTPTAKSSMLVDLQPGGTRTAERIGRGVAPTRLGHVLLFVTDVGRSIAFYERALGLRLSDRSGELVAFLHTPHGSDHHILAFAKSHRKGFHHASFDVGSPDRIGLGAMQMAAKGYQRGWGLGRHVAGSNLFHYVQDPWGSFIEYFCDIDYVPAGMDWQAQDLPPEDALYLWGPPVPDYFLANSEAHDG